MNKRIKLNGRQVIIDNIYGPEDDVNIEAFYHDTGEALNAQEVLEVLELYFDHVNELWFQKSVASAEAEFERYQDGD